MNEMKVSTGGLSTTLTIVFIILKLVGVISWSWIWVLAPLWIGFIAAVLFLGLVFVLAAFDILHLRK